MSLLTFVHFLVLCSLLTPAPCDVHTKTFSPYTVCPQIPIYSFLSSQSSDILSAKSVQLFSLPLTKYLSGIFQLGLQTLEEDVWLAGQLRPKKDIDHRGTSSNYRQKNLKCMKTKLRSFHSFLMTERSLERYKVRDDLGWNEMLNIASNAGFLQAAPDKLKRLQK